MTNLRIMPRNIHFFVLSFVSTYYLSRYLYLKALLTFGLLFQELSFFSREYVSLREDDFLTAQGQNTSTKDRKGDATRYWDKKVKGDQKG